MPIVHIDARRIDGWSAFHDVFAAALGFPSFYGRNMNAWIDCMTYLDDPGAGMSTIHGSASDVVVLHLEHVTALRETQREIYDAIIEGAAFVNWRRIDLGEPAILALSFHA